MPRTFTDVWISYQTAALLRGKVTPNPSKFFICFANTSALTRQSTPLDFALAELKQEDGYARSQVTFDSDGVFSIASKRHDMPIVTAVLNPTGAIQFQTAFLVANGNATANKLFNAATDVNAAANTISINAHGLSNGEQICFSAESGATLPGGLTANTLYQAINVSANSFQVSSDGAIAIDITATGVGQCRLRYVPDHVVMLETFDSVQSAPADKALYYDLQISGFNTLYGAGV